MSTDLPLLLLQGFRVLIDGLHAELARHGHPDVRPVHGFVLQAVADGCTAVELGRRLGVTKQAAAKHVEVLEGLGYLRRVPDPHDARARIVRRTVRGEDCLARSARILGDLREGWVKVLGPDRVHALEHDLRAVTADAPLRVDVPGWLGL
ncbi:MarR family winged helix-turn-helix transcriptional regulator [Pseudonocardia abyssalis]|uniref:MarR family winged helix-turn-helix transcriptional regulator n=1 Tax=Pseudonocardia abyssalis TaxID=2792008 RepID=UPI0035566148